MTNYMHIYFYNSLEMLVNIEGKGNISLPFIHRGTFKDQTGRMMKLDSNKLQQSPFVMYYLQTFTLCRFYKCLKY